MSATIRTTCHAQSLRRLRSIRKLRRNRAQAPAHRRSSINRSAISEVRASLAEISAVIFAATPPGAVLDGRDIAP